MQDTFNSTPTQSNPGSWRGASQRWTAERFIAFARSVHGDRYDYSLVVYRNDDIHVVIICPQHGEFRQIPGKHKAGQGCRFCAATQRNYDRRLTLDDFLRRASEKHGERYDYQKVNITGVDSFCTITCRVHGDFEQTPYKHLRGQGCPGCRYISGGDSLRKTLVRFVEDARRVHGDKFDYSLVEYRRNGVLVTIVCPKHGQFQQTPANHLMGKGCRFCSRSLGEEAVEACLNKYGVTFIRQAKFDTCRNKVRLRFDFYLPDHMTLIEYDGLQHFEPVADFGGQFSHDQLKENDAIKTEWASSNGYTLLRIPYWEQSNIELHIVRLLEGAK